VADTIARLCADSSDRIPKGLLPVVRANVDRGGELLRSAAIIASWARYAEGVDEQGRPIEVVDPLRDRLRTNARTGTFIDDRELFGDIGQDPRVRAAFDDVLDSLHEHGALATLRALAPRRA
jgi:mannitol 2-dehydrogenase